jgi:hypothetical protein
MKADGMRGQEVVPGFPVGEPVYDEFGDQSLRVGEIRPSASLTGLAAHAIVLSASTKRFGPATTHGRASTT